MWSPCSWSTRRSQRPARRGARSSRGCLAELRRATRGALVIRTGDPVDVVPALADEAGVDVVHATEDFGPYGRRRDGAVADALGGQGRRLALVGSPYAVAPGTVTKDDGQPYAVFTPYSRAWRAVGWDEPSPAPTVRWVHGIDSDPLPTPPPLDAEIPAAGEAAAHERLDAFVAGDLASYDATPRPPRSRRLQPPVAVPALGLPPPAPGAHPPRPQPGARPLPHRARLAGVLRRRAVPPAPFGVVEPRRADGRDGGRRWSRRRRPLRGVGDRADRVSHRRCRHAPAPRHRLDAQPRPHGDGQLPREGPPPAVAVGRPPLPRPPRRRRPGLEQPRLAVGGRHRDRCGAVLPHLQPGHPVGAVRSPRRLHPALGAGAGRRRRQGGPCAVDSGARAFRLAIRGRWSTTPPSGRRRCAATRSWPPGGARRGGLALGSLECQRHRGLPRCSTNARPPS